VRQALTPSRFFSKKILFNHILRNEFRSIFLKNLTLLNSFSPSDMTYKIVVSCTLTRILSRVSLTTKSHHLLRLFDTVESLSRTV
jgi:hypothetical protein